MTTLLRACGFALALFAMTGAGPVLAQTGSSQDPDAQAQQERRVTQPGNNAPVWREVRSGNQGYTSLPGRETGVLVQSAGETWRQIRNGPVTFYGGWLVVIVALVLAAIYFALGPVKLHEKPTGRMIERFTLAERWAHWVMGISFVVLGVTGLIILFGKHVLLPIIGYTLFAWLSALAKNLHNFVAPLFAVSLLVFIIMFIKDNLPKAYDFTWFARAPGFFTGRHLPSGRFNAGEKTWFWLGVVILSLALVVSGAILLFPNFEQVRLTMQQASVVHMVSAVLVIAASLGHIYLGTIGVDGAYRAMRDGVVDEEWAKEHHEYWYNEVKGGRKTAPGGAVPAGAPHMREKP
ncbi:MAG: formate dehydrogenase subunit gamma [Betaproteobacteria bacterium]|nr:formate dehydrogenase subunit gamma [Betaproteobacteria bacterium]MDH5221483.1 formate dehydrogenase subunit gamma [Betaproteobacteria bacterium]MDH5351142.1 formate dehydrogenase subunit gamma [Betaproteobacteria bacterium]